MFFFIRHIAASHLRCVCLDVGRQINNDKFQGQRSNNHPQRGDALETMT